MKYFQLYSTIYAVHGDPIPATAKEKGGIMVQPIGTVTKGGTIPKQATKYRMEWPVHPVSAAELRELIELPKELQQ